ncbi:hypothetical protein [Microbispora sp. KK1-11]|nr:hypothetical protein [Microbispora sp. KK1-11]
MPRLTALAKREGLTFRRTIGTAERSFELTAQMVGVAGGDSLAR